MQSRDFNAAKLRTEDQITNAYLIVVAGLCPTAFRDNTSSAGACVRWTQQHHCHEPAGARWASTLLMECQKQARLRRGPVDAIPCLYQNTRKPARSAREQSDRASIDELRLSSAWSSWQWFGKSCVQCHSPRVMNVQSRELRFQPSRCTIDATPGIITTT